MIAEKAREKQWEFRDCLVVAYVEGMCVYTLVDEYKNKAQTNKQINRKKDFQTYHANRQSIDRQMY